jgi:hypothetical protein
MSAGRYDRLVIEQGATFELDVALERPEGTPWDLTGAVVRAKVRALFASTSALIDFEVQTVSLTGGQVTLFLAASATDSSAATRTVFMFAPTIC